MTAYLLQAFQQVLPDNPYREYDTATDLFYSDKQDRGGSISAHRDDENPKWGLVLNFSLGQTRYLRIRHDGKFVATVAMPHNSLVCMYGKHFQRDYTHQVNKLKPGEEIHPRYSLNVRFTKEGRR
jgi:alkylated DNA repair dioxygenase AlkB